MLGGNGRIPISPRGKASVDNVIGQDEDLLMFTPTTLGEVNSGSWEIYFDGSDVALDSFREDVDGAAVNAAGTLLLTTNVNTATTDINTAAPTATPLPPTSTPPPPTATPVGSTMHVGDLDSSTTSEGFRWNAVVTITVHDNTNNFFC